MNILHLQINFILAVEKKKLEINLFNLFKFSCKEEKKLYKKTLKTLIMFWILKIYFCYYVVYPYGFYEGSLLHLAR